MGCNSEAYWTGIVRKTIPILCAILLWVGSGARAADLSQVDVAQAVKDLGAPSFAVRKAAQAALAGVGWEARKELEEAVRSGDPEVSDVARQLLAEMLPGVTRTTPDTQRELVTRYAKDLPADEKRNCVRQLLDESPVPCRLLLDLIEWETEDASRKQIVGEVLGRTPAVLGPMLETGETADYDRFLQWAVRLEAADLIPRVVVYAWYRGKLPVMQAQVAAQLAKADNPYLRRLLAELQVMGGTPDQAVETARSLENPVYWQNLLVRTGSWAELAASLDSGTDPPDGPELIRLAAAQRLAGQDAAAAATLAKLAAADQEDGKAPKTGGLGDAPAQIVWQDHGFGPELFGDRGMVVLPAGANELRLAMQQVRISSGRRSGRQQQVEAWRLPLAYGLVGDAVAFIQRQGQASQAVTFLTQFYRYAEADRLLKEELAAAQPPQDAFLTIRRAALLRSLGDPAADTMVTDILARCRNGDEKLADDKVFGALMIAVDSAGFHDVLVASLPELMARFANPLDQSALVQVVNLLASRQDRGLAWFWWTRMVQANPGEATTERAARLRDFLAGKLAAEAADTVLRSAVRPDASASERVQDLCQVSRTCLALWRLDDAVTASRLAVRAAVDCKDRNMGRYARSSLMTALVCSRKWEEAAAEYSESWRDGRDVTSLGMQGIALFLAGHREEAEKSLDRFAVLAGPSQVGWALTQLDELPWSEPVRRLLPRVVYGDSLAVELPATAARRLGDPALELQFARRQWFEGVQAVSSRSPEQLLQGNATLAFAECRARLANAGPAATLAEAKQVSDAFPFDVDGVADTVEALDRAGAKAEADALCEYALAREQRILDKLPDAVKHLNGYAWLCARTGRNLAKGEDYARRAIAKVPEQDEIVDTLAVLRYRQGDLDGAIAAGLASLRLEPWSVHYRLQLGLWEAEKANRH